MSQVIAVICDTPGCNTVWFNNSFIRIGLGASVSMTGNRAGPCPNCGGMGHIPDGMYTHASAILLNKDDLTKVLNALVSLRALAQSGADPETIKGEIKSKYPFLKSLANLLPKNRKEVLLYLSLMLNLMVYLSRPSAAVQQQEVHALQQVSVVLEQVSRDLKTSRQKSPRQRKHTSKKRPGEH